MSAMNELRRRLRAEESPPRFEACLPRPARELPAVRREAEEDWRQ